MAEDTTVNISTLIENNCIKNDYILRNEDDVNNIILNISGETIIVDSNITIKGFYDSTNSEIYFTSGYTLTLDSKLKIENGGSLEIKEAKLVINKNSIINGTLNCATLQV